MRARLTPIDGGPPIELEKELTVVGRNDDCDVRIEHKSVSKLHCVLVRTSGLVLVRDLGSTNGTRVNGQRVRRAALLPNDLVGIASFRYRMKFGNEPEPPLPEKTVGPASQDAADEADDTPAPEPSPLKPRETEPPLKRNALPDVIDEPPAKG